MMDPLPTALCYLAALACWLVAAAGVEVARPGRNPLNFVALGLAFFVLPVLWAAMSAA